MRPAVPTAVDVIRLCTRGRHAPPPPMPITDTAPDPGLFGPGSATWAVMREPALILGGARALLLQAAHPLVAQGALDHSSYASDPFGRLQRTLTWVTRVSFGTSAEARAACGTVNRMHRRVAGVLPDDAGTARVVGATPYSAMDEDLLVWVLATFVDTMLVTHDALVGGLDEAQRDAFVVEWHRVGRLMRVPAARLWPTRAELADYVAEQVRTGPVRPGPGSRRVSATILRPPLPTVKARAAFDTVIFVAAGLLPEALRRGYGIRWSAAHDTAHLSVRLWSRGFHRALPDRLHVSPVYERALARVEGRLPAEETAGRDGRGIPPRGAHPTARARGARAA